MSNHWLGGTPVAQGFDTFESGVYDRSTRSVSGTGISEIITAAALVGSKGLHCRGNNANSGSASTNIANVNLSEYWFGFRAKTLALPSTARHASLREIAGLAYIRNAASNAFQCELVYGEVVALSGRYELLCSIYSNATPTVETIDAIGTGFEMDPFVEHAFKVHVKTGLGGLIKVYVDGTLVINKDPINLGANAGDSLVLRARTRVSGSNWATVFCEHYYDEAWISATDITASLPLPNPTGTPPHYTWEDFNIAANWATGLVPVAAESIVFNAGSLQRCVRDSSSAALSLGSVLLDSSFSNVATLYGVTGTGTVDNGTLEHMAGTIEIDGGNLNYCTGTINNMGGMEHGGTWTSMRLSYGSCDGACNGILTILNGGYSGTLTGTLRATGGDLGGSTLNITDISTIDDSASSGNLVGATINCYASLVINNTGMNGLVLPATIRLGSTAGTAMFLGFSQSPEVDILSAIVPAAAKVLENTVFDHNAMGTLPANSVLVAAGGNFVDPADGNVRAGTPVGAPPRAGSMDSSPRTLKVGF